MAAMPAGVHNPLVGRSERQPGFFLHFNCIHVCSDHQSFALLSLFQQSYHPRFSDSRFDPKSYFFQIVCNKSSGLFFTKSDFGNPMQCSSCLYGLFLLRLNQSLKILFRILPEVLFGRRMA